MRKFSARELRICSSKVRASREGRIVSQLRLHVLQSAVPRRPIDLICASGGASAARRVAVQIGGYRVDRPQAL